MMLPAMQPACPATLGAVRRGFSSVKLPFFISGVGTVEMMVVALRLVKSCKSPEEERLVLDDRAADGAAELVLAEVPARDAARVIEEGIRVQIAVAEKLPDVAMKLIRAALDGGVDHGAGGGSELRRISARLDAKLLQARRAAAGRLAPNLPADWSSRSCYPRHRARNSSAVSRLPLELKRSGAVLFVFVRFF